VKAIQEIIGIDMVAVKSAAASIVKQYPLVADIEAVELYNRVRLTGDSDTIDALMAVISGSISGEEVDENKSTDVVSEGEEIVTEEEKESKE
jgi:ADP-ribosylglycohydrolase